MQSHGFVDHADFDNAQFFGHAMKSPYRPPTLLRALAAGFILFGLHYVQQDAKELDFVRSVSAQWPVLPGPGLPVAAGGGGGVTVDAVGHLVISAASTTASGTPITVGAGATGLLALVSFTNSSTTVPTGVSCTWNGTNMPIVSGTTESANDTVQGVETLILGLTSPTSGTQTLACTWTNTSSGYIGAISFKGSNSTFASAFINGNIGTGTSTTPAITVTSASNQVAVGAYVSRGGVGGSFASVNNTQIYLDNSGAVGNGAANYLQPGSGSSALNGTLNSSALWSSSGVSVSP